MLLMPSDALSRSPVSDPEPDELLAEGLASSAEVRACSKQIRATWQGWVPSEAEPGSCRMSEILECPEPTSY